MELDVADSEVNGFIVVSVGGELDVYTAPVLEERLNELIVGASPQVVVDLTDVGFLDSTGLGVMVKALKRVKEKGGTLQVVAPEERISKVFTITGLDEAMSLSTSLAAAVGS